LAASRTRRRLLGNAVAVLIAGLVRGDQLREEADRHHLGAEEQGGHGVDQQRPVVQRGGRSGIEPAPDPGVAEIEHARQASEEAQHADAAEQVLRPLTESGEELDREQVEEALHEAADAVLGAAEPARAMADLDLRYLEPTGRGEHRNEAVQLAVEADLAEN